MWIALNTGFLSVVQLKDSPNCLLVRARVRAHLKTFLGKNRAEITETPRNDYRWRTVLSRGEFTRLMADQIASIEYSNFKDSVKDKPLHDMYMHWWFDHHALQTRSLPKRRKRRGRKHAPALTAYQTFFDPSLGRIGGPFGMTTTTIRQRTRDSFWTYRAATPTPDFADVSTDAFFGGTRDEWEALSPGMRREIVRTHEKGTKS